MKQNYIDPSRYRPELPEQIKVISMSKSDDINIGAILISSKILLERETPSWMYREKGIEQIDSGWRVFSGNEDENYLSEPSNFKTITAAQLISIDDSLKVNLFAPIGSSFEKDFETNQWIPIEKG